MHKLKQGTAAVVLVASLGLIVPGSFGGSASADVSHNPNHDQTPFKVVCDLGGDSNADTEYVPEHYETPYIFVSTANSKSMHDQNSNTVLMHRERLDVLQAQYVRETPLEPEDSDHPNDFTDIDVEWFDPSDVSLPPRGIHTVRCVNIAYPEIFTATQADADLEGRLAVGATYSETDYQLYWAQLSASGKGTAQANELSASGKGAGQANDSHKHRGKRKHRK